MLITVALLVILFQIFQMIGMKIASVLDHRK
jgi:ABC-type methionine transport system permease subunit